MSSSAVCSVGGNYCVIHGGHAYCAARPSERCRCVYYFPRDGEYVIDGYGIVGADCAHASSGRCTNRYAIEEARHDGRESTA